MEWIFSVNYNFSFSNPLKMKKYWRD